MDIDTFIVAAVAKLAELAIDPVVQWSVAVELVALKHGWTTDEASANLANLLDSLT